MFITLSWTTRYQFTHTTLLFSPQLKWTTTNLFSFWGHISTSGVYANKLIIQQLTTSLTRLQYLQTNVSHLSSILNQRLNKYHTKSIVKLKGGTSIYRPKIKMSLLLSIVKSCWVFSQVCFSAKLVTHDLVSKWLGLMEHINRPLTTMSTYPPLLITMHL